MYKKILLKISLIIYIVATQVLSAEEINFKDDKTGTNPVNFKHDFRVYNEYFWLNTEGDGKQNVTTLEYRTPFLDGKWQFRTRIRGTYTKADLNDDGADDLDSKGLGEIDFRFATVPYFNLKKRKALAFGFETFLPTGNSATGSEQLSLGPQVFAVFFAPFGLKGTLISPAYQHKFSVYEENDAENIHQSLIDVFFLWKSSDQKKWALIDPQAVIDHENNEEFGIVQIEMGLIVDDYLNTDGHSIFMQPSIGLGTDRPFDDSIQFGYRVIW